jgi:tRNA(adenine34) deaminase
MMRLALEEARNALHLGEVPIGAVIAQEQEVIAVGFNQPIRAVDPTAHAEVVAIRKAARELSNYRLSGLTLYVTVEPCMMCVGAIVQARIGTLVYGAPEPKFGAVDSLLDLREMRIPHRLSIVSGILEEECRKVLQDFFQYRRDND